MKRTSSSYIETHKGLFYSIQKPKAVVHINNPDFTIKLIILAINAINSKELSRKNIKDSHSAVKT